MNYLSVAGKHHNYDEKNNQDAIIFKMNTDYCAMVLADGVSTCEEGGTGAKTTCAATAEFLLDHAERIFNMNKQKTADSLVEHIMQHLKENAENENKDVEEYSSTLACVLFDRKENKMLYLSIGDSLIIATQNDKCYVVAMPSDSRNGCCVTTTLNASRMAKVGIVDTENLGSIMICSDGAWHLMYRRNTMEQPIKELILNNDYTGLKEILLEKERFDDCSFITINLKDYSRRKTA